MKFLVYNHDIASYNGHDSRYYIATPSVIQQSASCCALNNNYAIVYTVDLRFICFTDAAILLACNVYKNIIQII